MKRIIPIILAATALLAVAASTPTWGVVRPWRIQVCDVVSDATGNVTAAPITVMFRAPLLDGSGAIVIGGNGQPIYNDSGSVTWDAVATANTTVSANGKTYTRGELLSAILADAAAQQAAH